MNLPAFTKTYDNRTVLDFPGYSLQHGKIYAVIGANGSGKSTFAKILAGVLDADRRLDRTTLGTVGYLPQKAFAFRMRTRSNLLLGGKDEAKAARLMQALQIDHLADKRADRLPAVKRHAWPWRG